jgi:hypothetical protein
MKRRRYHISPPVNAKYTVGEVIEFSPADDKLNAGKSLPPVELTPVGPSAIVIEFGPEDETVRPTTLNHDHPLRAWVQHLLAPDRASHPNEFAVFDLVVGGLSLSAAATQLGISVPDAANAYRLMQAKLLHAMRADPICRLIKAALEAESPSQK